MPSTTEQVHLLAFLVRLIFARHVLDVGIIDDTSALTVPRRYSETVMGGRRASRSATQTVKLRGAAFRSTGGLEDAIASALGDIARVCQAIGKIAGFARYVRFPALVSRFVSPRGARRASTARRAAVEMPIGVIDTLTPFPTCSRMLPMRRNVLSAGSFGARCERAVPIRSQLDRRGTMAEIVV